MKIRIAALVLTGQLSLGVVALTEQGSLCCDSNTKIYATMNESYLFSKTYPLAL